MAAALRVGVVVAAIAASACQLVLGFEERLPFPSSAGGGGEGGSGGGPSGGAPSGGAPSGFGDPEEVATGLGPIDAVAISGDDVYVLEQAFGAFQIQRLRGGTLEVVASGLPLARGLVAAGDEVLTTHGPLDQLDPQCHVSAFGRAGKRDVMRDFCDQDENKFFALAVEGDTMAASFLDTQGADHSDVRTSSVSGTGAVGTLIGLGEAEDEGVPSSPSPAAFSSGSTRSSTT